MEEPQSSDERPRRRRRSAPRARRRGTERAHQVTGRDLALLAFAAEHRVVLPEHVQWLLGVALRTAQARLRVLADADCLAGRKPYGNQPMHFQITRQGLGALASRYVPPRANLSSYDHDIGLAWMWLAARAGVWGRMQDVVSERRMRSADGVAEHAGDGPAGESEPFGVRLLGHGPGGRERLHYPDLLLVAPDGRRVALELELTAKSRTRLEKVIGAYALDRRIDAVVYLVDDEAIGRSVRAAARRFGIEDMVRVQPVRWRAGARPSVAARVPARGERRPRSIESREAAL